MVPMFVISSNYSYTYALGCSSKTYTNEAVRVGVGGGIGGKLKRWYKVNKLDNERYLLDTEWEDTYSGGRPGGKYLHLAGSI